MISPDATAACALTRRLQEADTKVLHASDNEALVRASLEYATAVGAFYDTRDLKVVKEDGAWKVEWPVVKEAKVPPWSSRRTTFAGT